MMVTMEYGPWPYGSWNLWYGMGYVYEPIPYDYVYDCVVCCMCMYQLSLYDCIMYADVSLAPNWGGLGGLKPPNFERGGYILGKPP